MEKYFIYCRKSSESEDRQVLSIESQVNEMKALASRLGLQITETFTESKTAKEPGRTVFNDLMKKVYAGEAQGVLCWKLDRLARNPIDGAAVIWALKRNGVKIITPNQTYSHGDDNTILMYVEFGMAQKYVDDLSKNVKRGNKAKLEKGEWPTVAPLGYLNHTDPITKEVTIVPDEMRFPILRKMWDMMLGRIYTVEQIVDIANTQLGLRTRKTKRQGGEPISRSLGYRIFTNPFYYGLMERREGMYFHKYKRLVTREEFDRVQDILGRKGKPRPKTHAFAFTGMIRCGECGCMITAEEISKFIKKDGQMRSYTYYRCTKKKKGAKCSQSAISLSELSEQISDFLDQVHVPIRSLNRAFDEITRFRQKKEEFKWLLVENLEQIYAKTIKSLEVLIDMRVRELINDDIFTNKKKKMEGERDQIEGRLKLARSQEKQWKGAAHNIFAFAHHAKMRFKTGNLMTQKKALDYIGSNWTLMDKKLSGDLWKPFMLIDETWNQIRSRKPRLQPSEYLRQEPQNDDSEIENINMRALITDVRNAVLESEHDYSFNMPEFLEEEKPAA